jgi:hypothetical protein
LANSGETGPLGPEKAQASKYQNIEKYKTQLLPRIGIILGRVWVVTLEDPGTVVWAAETWT